MKTLLIALAIAAHASAATWAELEPEQSYNLTQDIQLQQTERSGSFVDLAIGESFKLRDIVPLEMINVTAFVFDYKNCSGPELRTEMAIVPVKSTLVEVGALIEKGCALEVYIENKDLMTSSFFE